MERQQEHLQLNRVALDQDYADEVVIEHCASFIPWIDKDFDDKLSPVKRWLEKQVGRHWDAVYSKIRKKFDIRTTPGRHIVEDHLFHWVNVHHKCDRGYWHDGKFYTYYSYEFDIDEYGILIRRERQ